MPPSLRPPSPLRGFGETRFQECALNHAGRRTVRLKADPTYDMDACQGYPWRLSPDYNSNLIDWRTARSPMRTPPAAALTFALIAHGVAAQPGDDPQKDIQAIYNRSSAATVSAKTYADADATHKWLDTADCTFTNFMQPARTWAEMRPEVEASLATPLSALSAVIRKLEVTGTTAIATAVVEGTMRIVDDAGQYGAKGVAHD